MTHFVDNGQLLLYAKELEHAREILYKLETEGCEPHAPPPPPPPPVVAPRSEGEVSEAVTAGARPKLPDRSKAFFAAGGTLVGAGIGALVAGIALLVASGLSNEGGQSTDSVLWLNTTAHQEVITRPVVIRTAEKSRWG